MMTFFPVNLEAALILQSSVRAPAGMTTASSSLRFFTSLQFPFKLVNPTWGNVSRSDFTYQAAESFAYLSQHEDCLNSRDDATCEQEWEIGFNAPSSPPTCNFNGDYTLEFIVRCQDVELGHCALPLNTMNGLYEAKATVQFHIVTENFCPTLFADVPITASLHSYQDPERTISKTDFLLGSTGYFKAVVFSQEATIVETSFQTIHDATILFFTRPTNNYPNELSIQEFPRPTNRPTQAWFDLVLSPSLFSVPIDGSASASFTVMLNVVFWNTNGITHSLAIPLRPDTIVRLETKDSGFLPVEARTSLSLTSGPSAPIIASPTSGSSSAGLAIGLGSSIGVIALISSLVLIRQKVCLKKNIVPPAIALEAV
jgi:hypothetical protein